MQKGHTHMPIVILGRDTSTGKFVEIPANSQGLRAALHTAQVTLDDDRANNPEIPQTPEGDAPIVLYTYPYLFNGNKWDRQRSNTEGTAMADGTRNSSSGSATWTNYNARGIMLFFEITAAPGGGDQIEVRLQAVRPDGTIFGNLLKSGWLTATGKYTLQVGPGVGDSAGELTACNDVQLPRSWRVWVEHSGTGDFTYSAQYSYIL